MKQFTAVLSLLAAAGVSVAQEQYHISPDSVDKAQRDTWCNNQKTQCPLICTQLPGAQSDQTQTNDCDADNLTYECVCENGQRPNVTQYSQTLPFYICQEWGTQCVAKCGNDNSCSYKCRANHPCGAQDPPKPNNTRSSSAPATAAATGSRASDTGLGNTGTFEGSGKSAANAMVSLGQGFGLTVLVSGLFAGMALIL